ncbi:CoA ester lyase [Acidisphaera sp. L21]|uniref:HpcH/HpaI aldolase/citrate lyase family protein n=1 Tax=Acidisphaera sp. L21 TaxID=1641851 RepID=UPI00131C1EF6|nr:CoA ester lyase [Acidisphaera sp. L21]
MKLRSLLFAPGDSERKAAKAVASEADGVILDLEDSVAPGQKDMARGMVAAMLPMDRAVVVRVNPPGTPWYLADLAAVVPSRPHAILLPKCTGPADLAALDHHLEALETASGLPPGGIGVLALVTETADSLRSMDYAGSTPRLLGLCFGAEDLSADLGIAPRGPDGYAAPVMAARAATLLAAAWAGVPAIDTPWPDPKDAAGMVREAAQAARDGFVGKLCIHPGQIAPANAAFTPSEERVVWARRVEAAFAASPDSGVLTLDGAMIDQPHLKLARRILASI